MNMIANILGLGNAATPLGIKAMKTLQKIIKTNDFIKLNVNVYFDKYSFNSAYTNKCNCYKKLTKFFYVNSDNFPVWIATITAALASIITAKVLIRLGNKR